MMTISPKAIAGNFNPKKIIDHKALRISCPLKMVKALLCWLQSNSWLTELEDCQIKYKEIPIKAYKRVQTGAKSQLGGESKGLFKVAYQTGIAEKVKIEPIIPAPSQIRIEETNFSQSFLVI